MKRLIALAALIASLALGGCPSHPKPTPTLPDSVTHPDDTDSGLLPPAPPPAPASVVLPATVESTISVAAWFPAGSQDDPAGKEGLAWITGQLIARGATTSHPYDQILGLLYPMAADYDTSVDREMTVVAGRVHKDHAAAYLRLFVDAYAHPAFAAADLERLRAEAIAAIEKQLRYAQDEELAKATFMEALFSGTPYAHLVVGTVAGLKAITLDDVRGFYQVHYASNLVTFGLAGGWDEAARTALEGSRAELPAPRALVAPPAPAPVVHGRRVVIVNKPGADASISFGAPVAVHRGERDFYALAMASSWLGEHRNSLSHLYQVIRAARGLNYGDYAYIEAYPEGGNRESPPPSVGRRSQAFEVWIRTLPSNNAPFALRAAIREIDRLIERGLTAEQFEHHRAFMKKYIRHYAESSEDQLLWALDDRFYGLPESHLARFATMLDQLTVDEVNAAIKKYLSTDNLVIAISTGDPDGVRAALIGTAPTPPSYPTAKPAEITKEDREIAAWPLAIDADAITVVPVDDMFAK